MSILASSASQRLQFKGILLLLFAQACLSSLAWAGSVQSVSVPFVGCESDGQVGPVPAPVGSTLALKVPAPVANRLAYHKAQQSPGVLAPRGWYCFSTYGSNGSNLYVSPEPIQADYLSSQDQAFQGPAIQLSDSVGYTSGRFEVALIVARVFPAYRWFVNSLINNSLASATDFKFGPYPHDKLRYKTKSVVEYETPKLTDDLGTHSKLLATNSPIDGVITLTGPAEDLNLRLLAIRLPSNLTDLAPIIIRQVEQEAK